MILFSEPRPKSVIAAECDRNLNQTDSGDKLCWLLEKPPPKVKTT